MAVVECPKPVTKQKSRPDVPGGLACCQGWRALMQKYKNLVGDALRCSSFLYNVYNQYMCYYRVSSEICQCSTTRSCHVRETHFLVKPPGLFRRFDGADKKESVTCPFSTNNWLWFLLRELIIQDHIRR